MNALYFRRLMLALLFLSPSISMAQKMDDIKWEPQPLPTFTHLPKSKPTNILSDYAFDRFITKNFNFAILGDNVPVTGIKVETTKPSVTLAGSFPVGSSKTKVLNLELTTGVKENIAELFSSNKTSQYFKASLGFTYLWPGNKANIASAPSIKRTDNLANLAKEKQILDSIARINKYVKIALIHKTLADQRFFEYKNKTKFQEVYEDYAGFKKPDADFFKRETPLILAVLEDYGNPEKDIDKALKGFVLRWQAAEADTVTSINSTVPLKDMINRTQASLFEKNYQKGGEVLRLAKDSVADAEIKLYGKRFSSYNLLYGSIVPTISNTSFYHYNNVGDTSLTQRNSFVPAVKIGFSWYKKYTNAKGKFRLLTISTTPKRTNSLDDMTQVNYKIVAGNEAFAKKTKSVNEDESGKAYKGNFEVGFGIETSAELYWVFTKHRGIPGIYLKAGYAYGKPWVNQRQVPAEGGLLFNIDSKTKDAVNYLSLIPYVAWTNLKSSVDIEGKEVFLHDKFSFGVKLGIPVNIGK